MSEVQAQEVRAETPSDSALSTQHSALNEGRRAEIDAKQGQVAELLQQAGADGLLLLEPFGLAWFSGAPLADGTPDPATRPALYLTATQRWLVAANVDSQYLFDAFLDGLGFQLKEWPWHWGRAQLLLDLTHNRKVVVDRPYRDLHAVAEPLRHLRAALTPAEQGRLRELGKVVAHALEAAARNLAPGQSEHEIAGQLGHRLLRHGAAPVSLTVAADGRHRRYRRPTVTDAAVTRSCLLAVTATRDGLHATAARTVSFGPPDASEKGELDAASRVQAGQVAAALPGVLPAAVLESARRVAKMVGHEHEWRLSPAGTLTGWRPVEALLTPGLAEPLPVGSAVVWQSAVGSALAADTFLTAAPVPECVTPAEGWLLKRIKVAGGVVDVPDVLVRD
jgi:Xaa-Pro dipeptidase